MLCIVRGPTGLASRGAGLTVKFSGGTIVAALGQGSWHLGQGRHLAAAEEALRTGLSLGMTLIDTLGNFGGGRRVLGWAQGPRRWGCCLPPPSRNRTCIFPVSVSSRESFAHPVVARDDPCCRQRMSFEEFSKAVPREPPLPTPPRQPFLPNP